MRQYDYSGTLRQASRNTFKKKMFQDLKNTIYHPILTILGGIKDSGGLNPKRLEFRDFSTKTEINIM